MRKTRTAASSMRVRIGLMAMLMLLSACVGGLQSGDAARVIEPPDSPSIDAALERAGYTDHGHDDDLVRQTRGVCREFGPLARERELRSAALDPPLVAADGTPVRAAPFKRARVAILWCTPGGAGAWNFSVNTDEAAFITYYNVDGVWHGFYGWERTVAPDASPAPQQWEQVARAADWSEQARAVRGYALCQQIFGTHASFPRPPDTSLDPQHPSLFCFGRDARGTTQAVRLVAPAAAWDAPAPRPIATAWGTLTPYLASIERQCAPPLYAYQGVENRTIGASGATRQRLVCLRIGQGFGGTGRRVLFDLPLTGVSDEQFAQYEERAIALLDAQERCARALPWASVRPMPDGRRNSAHLVEVEPNRYRCVTSITHDPIPAVGDYVAQALP